MTPQIHSICGSIFLLHVTMILIIWVPFIIFCLRINCDDIYLFMFAKCFLYTNSTCILRILLRFGIFREHKCLCFYLYLCRLRSSDIKQLNFFLSSVFVVPDLNVLYLLLAYHYFALLWFFSLFVCLTYLWLDSCLSK